MNWEPLIRKTVLGTQREPFVDADIIALRQYAGLKQFAAQTDELQLLETAALFGLLRKAGSRLPLADAAQIPALPAAEPLPYCSPEVATGLKSVLNTDQEELLLEVLSLLSQCQQLLPTYLLPLVLNKAKEKNNLMVVLPASLGQRGHWLLRLNKDWSELLVEENLDSSAFFALPFAAQIQYLSALRIQKSPKVLPLVEAIFNKENSAARARLLALLGLHLSAADMPFLQNCIHDKSKEVQRKAISLLSLLPESDYTRSMQERLALLIPDNDWKKIQLPLASADMERNLLDAPYPDWKASEQEYLLARIIAVVPPQWWIERWGSPDKLLKASQSHPLQKPLWWGWQQAAQKFENADWLSALYRIYINNDQKNSPFVSEQLLEKTLQSSEAFHSLAQTLLEEHKSTLSDEHPIVDFIGRHALPLRDELVRDIIRRIRNRIKKDTYFMDWGLQGMLKHLAYFVNPALHDWLRSDWDEHSVAWASWRNTVGQFLNIINIRLLFYNNMKTTYTAQTQALSDLYALTLNKRK